MFHNLIMRAITGLYFVLAAFIFTRAYALDCYQCSQVNDANTCNTSRTCNAEETCFTNAVPVQQGVRYDMGCIEHSKCGNLTNPVSLVGRRELECHECCSRDLCNQALCQGVKSSTCEDDLNEDCVKLDSLFHLCNDVPHARLICPRYCNLCNIGDVGCRDNEWMCLTSNKCIPAGWRCDSDTDCGDGDTSDEENCPPTTCTENEFSCPGNGQCIPERWKCDGDIDCQPNGEDEDHKTCPYGECSYEWGSMTCPDGTCIIKLLICDGHDDCSDGRDETNCTKTCADDMHTCSDGQCISSHWVCDGDHDCRDRSDEVGCKVCQVDQFKCNDSSRCIDVKWRCDGDFDCQDHSDETNCSDSIGKSEVCLHTEFQCRMSLECIHKSWLCDGDVDCTDMSDEGAECNRSCAEDQFKCGSRVCISKRLVCDGNYDCMDGTDEVNCIDGAWSKWSIWSPCDVTCGNGTQTRARLCNSPTPSQNGEHCKGTDHEIRDCINRKCPVYTG